MKPLTVVIADDHPEFRKYLANFIKRLKGVEVVARVRDGFEAISAAELLHPDVMLLDITMLDISGLEAATQIKEKYPETKVVFVTVHDGQTYKALAEILHVDGFVCKSTLEEKLPGMLKVFKEKRNGQKETVEYPTI